MGRRGDARDIPLFSGIRGSSALVGRVKKIKSGDKGGFEALVAESKELSRGTKFPAPVHGPVHLSAGNQAEEHLTPRRTRVVTRSSYPSNRSNLDVITDGPKLLFVLHYLDPELLDRSQQGRFVHLGLLHPTLAVRFSLWRREVETTRSPRETHYLAAHLPDGRMTGCWTVSKCTPCR